MAIERDNKILNGAGLETYTGLLKTYLDGVTTTIAGDISTAMSTAISTVVNGATTYQDLAAAENAILALDERLDTAEGAIGETEDGIATIAQEVWGNTTYTEPSRIDNLESAVDSITNTIQSINTTVDGLTTTTIPGIQDDINGLTTLAATLPNTYKIQQAAATLTAPAGEYISGISQDVQGVVSITTTALPSVSEATDASAGIVTMASGATTAVVYDTVQVDDLITGITTDLSDLEGRVNSAEDAIDSITTTLIPGLTETYKALQTPYAFTATAGSFISEMHQDNQGIIEAITTPFPAASSATLGMVTIVGVTTAETNPVNQVYSRDKIDEIVAAIEGGGSATYKRLQDAVTFTVASGSYISELSQNANGEITATTAPLPAASTTTAGLMQYSAGVTATAPRVYDTVEVDRLINEAKAAAFVAEVTTDLPATGDENTIYFVSNGSSTTPNYYTEYMYVNNQWEVVGDTELTIEALSTNEVESIFNEVFNPTNP